MTREEREKAIDALKISAPVKAVTQEEFNDYIQTLNKIMDWLDQEPCEDMGEVSDGYHTFNQLYHQRAVLFATIVNQNKDKAWKSFKHSDGNYCFDSNGEWFIVGIDTPQGSYTYHYAKDYWDMFDCEELECGKEWDGHTEEDVTRLLSLQNDPCDDYICREDALMALTGEYTDSPIEILSKAIKRINALPSVTPQPKMGEWYLDDEWRCSVCNCVCEDWRGIPTYKYCPQCGSYVGKRQEVKE